MSEALGIDIGGTGIKIALVNRCSCELSSEISYHETPTEVSPERLAELLAKLISNTGWTGPVGIGYPGVVIGGKTFSAAHLSDRWIEADALKIFCRLIPNRLTLINDADAAGLAEMTFGVGVSRNCVGGGAVLMLTFGTGIGSALFYDGQLFPNSELGHLLVGNLTAEDRASGKIKTELKLSWQAWSERLNLVLAEYEKLFSPELVIIGGGLSENFDQFAQLINCRAEIKGAEFTNSAGLIGAALNCPIE